MQIAVLLALLVVTCYAQLEQSDAALVEPSETGRVARNIEGGIGERSPFFFFTQTITIVSTTTAMTVTTLTTSSFCTVTTGALACTGKRRRRGIVMGDEEYIENVMAELKPSAVSAVEPTAAPADVIQPARQAREAQYVDHLVPILPTFPLISPRFKSQFASPQFRQDQQLVSAVQPQERILFVTTTSTSTVTSTVTVSSFSSIIPVTVSCTFTSPIAACAGK